MTPLGVKTCEESEFDIFKAKKRFPDPGKAGVLKRKVTKIAFLLLFAPLYRVVAPKGYIVLMDPFLCNF